jgi:Leucine-rich repeat (LRR) protein
MLTAEVVLARCKCEKLAQIKNINLWGSELEDVSILKDMPNIEICSLSLNKIRSLRDFTHCKKMTELYLRKNCIENLQDIKYLQHLPALKVLWLWDNPICQHPNYRSFIIKVLPTLTKLDNAAVTPEER